MPDILADYREWRAKQPTRIGTHSDRCHMWHERCMIHRLADALAVEQAKGAASEAEIDALEFVVEEGRIASHTEYGILRSWLCRLRPAWESTPSEPATLSEGTRQSEGTPEPLAWVAFAADASESVVAVMHREEAEEMAARHGWAVAPLYRSPSLTDAEREAIAQAIDAADGMAPAEPWAIATLRGLLARTSPERDATPPAADAMPERDRR